MTTSEDRARLVERDCKDCAYRGGGKRNRKTKGLCTARQCPQPKCPIRTASETTHD
jgi:hypothetical protein